MRLLFILLLFPLFSACNSEDSSNEPSSNNIIDYLNSNVFVMENISTVDDIEYPVQLFIQFNLIDGLGSTYCQSQLSESPSFNGTSNEPWNEYIMQNIYCEFYIYQEFENEIFIEMPICGNSTNRRYSISRNGNNITLLMLENNASWTYTITTFDYLQERKDVWNNNYSYNSNQTGDCY